MAEEKGYNGWTNYETWLVALWLDNERTSAEYWRDCAKHHSTYELSQQMKGEIEDGVPELDGFYADLLSAVLSEVNWMEIARHYMEVVAQ